jgi:hypothetical protein
MLKAGDRDEELKALVAQGKVAPPPEHPAKWREVRNEVTGCWRIEQ